MILNFTEELPPLTKEEVRQVFINTLDLLSGFSILFLQCSPAEANQLIPRVRQEFPKKNIEVLNLVKPINNLYKLVECREDRASLNILFVRGLEKSLQADIKPGYQGLGEYYNLNTVPPILVTTSAIFALFLYCQNLPLGTLSDVLQIFMIGILDCLK
jgi:hypothetical protein